MRIAVVGPLRFPNPQGGMTRHVEEIGARLADAGHDVTVFCKTPEPGVGTRYRGMQVRTVRGLRAPGWDRLGHTFVASLRAAIGHYDVVHFHSLTSSGFSLLPRLFGKRVVVTVHRLEWQDEKWNAAQRRFLRFAEWSAVHGAHALITVSRAFADDLASRYRRLPPTTYIANGVDPARRVGPAPLASFELEPDGYSLFVGRLVPEKGVHVLIDAFERLGTERLVLLGGARHEDDYVRGLRARAERSGGRIRFLGIQTGDVLAALYEHAKVLVAPSFHEGQPLAVLEAMTYGRCVVASDIPAHVELLAGTGMLWPVGSAADLADALRAVFADADLRRRSGDAGRSRIEESPEFRWGHAASETERVLTGA